MSGVDAQHLPYNEPEDNPSEDDDTIATEASNKALEVTTDFIIMRLKTSMDAYQFEHFVAHLLESMRYFTCVTQGSGDGGSQKPHAHVRPRTRHYRPVGADLLRNRAEQCNRELPAFDLTRPVPR